MQDEATPESKLRALRAAYTQKLHGTLDELCALGARVRAEPAPADRIDALENLRNLAHKLAGSAGTYGFADLSDAARTLERFSEPLIHNGATPTPERQAELDRHLSAVDRCGRTIAAKPDARTTSQQAGDVPGTGVAPLPARGNSSALQAGLAGEPAGAVLLIGDDPDHARRLESGLGAFGFELRVMDGRAGIGDTLERLQPAAVLLDREFLKGHAAAAREIRRLQTTMGLTCPLVLLTPRAGVSDRLASARAGFEHVLTKPVTLTDLVHFVETLTAGEAPQPERVLLVDDDPVVLREARTILQQANMIVTALSEPLSVLDTIEESCPELLLLGFRMPSCSGRELAAAIRQTPSYRALPIAYLASEHDRDLQVEAMQAGADDFLTKPLRARHLVSAVRARVAQFRALRRQSTRESLTGLYNHTTTRQLLENARARAGRSARPLSVAVLDIDGLAEMNAAHGYQAGDAAMRALAHVLRQRLRRGDLVGRFGNAEFCAILPDTTGAEARRLAGAVGAAFETITQLDAAANQRMTLSCGIAEHHGHEVEDDLLDTARTALASAKAAGRNTISLASDTERSRDEGAPRSGDRGSLERIADRSAPTRARDQQHARTPTAWKRALVIDDDPTICAFIKPFAEQSGFRVRAVTRPAHVTRQGGAASDLIVLDLNMPGMDGIEMLRFLGEANSHAAIVIVSAYDDEILSAVRKLATKQGLNIVGTLQKPIDPGALRQALDNAFRGQGSPKPHQAISSAAEAPPTAADLREALATGALTVYFQPKIDLACRRTTGAEALLRWHHPTKGTIPPHVFVPLAEREGLIDDLTILVLDQVCAQLRLWQQTGHTLTVSINVSERSFANLRFPEMISGKVREAGLQPTDIVLELTETSVISNTVALMDALTRLRLKGFKLSIDDFGTGHSSLARLTQLPFGELKIDKSFVGSAVADQGSRAIVKNTIDLAGELGLDTVAEGAETQQDIELLASFGCAAVQGYFFARPLPPQAFTEWLESNDTAGLTACTSAEQ